MLSSAVVDDVHVCSLLYVFDSHYHSSFPSIPFLSLFKSIALALSLWPLHYQCLLIVPIPHHPHSSALFNHPPHRARSFNALLSIISPSRQSPVLRPLEPINTALSHSPEQQTLMVMVLQSRKQPKRVILFRSGFLRHCSRFCAMYMIPIPFSQQTHHSS